MLRAKLAGRVNYPDSLHLNGWMSSALARRTLHQFKQEGEANKKFWAGGAQHCFEPIWSSTALPLLSSLHLCLCCRAASTPSPVHLFLLFPLKISLQGACWLLSPGSCLWCVSSSSATRNTFPELGSVCSLQQLWHYARSSLKWGCLGEHLQLSSNLPVPPERGQEPISPTQCPVQASPV